MIEKVDHEHLLEKMIEHEAKFIVITESIATIVDKLDPIADGVKSIAFAFRILLWVGAGSAATLGILELIDYLGE